MSERQNFSDVDTVLLLRCLGKRLSMITYHIQKYQQKMISAILNLFTNNKKIKYVGEVIFAKDAIPMKIYLDDLE